MKRNMLILGFMLVAFNLSAQQAEVFSKSGVAIRGYDAVAYFKEGKPVKTSVLALLPSRKSC